MFKIYKNPSVNISKLNTMSNKRRFGHKTFLALSVVYPGMSSLPFLFGGCGFLFLGLTCFMMHFDNGGGNAAAAAAAAAATAATAATDGPVSSAADAAAATAATAATDGPVSSAAAAAAATAATAATDGPVSSDYILDILRRMHGQTNVIR
jgi:hypothetical protein